MLLLREDQDKFNKKINKNVEKENFNDFIYQKLSYSNLFVNQF